MRKTLEDTEAEKNRLIKEAQLTEGRLKRADVLTVSPTPFQEPDSMKLCSRVMTFETLGENQAVKTGIVIANGEIRATPLVLQLARFNLRAACRSG